MCRRFRTEATKHQYVTVAEPWTGRGRTRAICSVSFEIHDMSQVRSASEENAGSASARFVLAAPPKRSEGLFAFDRHLDLKGETGG
ncbi:MAG: hypothetical protein ACI9KE_000511 [Polyangiales bacterium]|jgi:hypothetical protein